MSNESIIHPPVYWAQRKNLIYLRVAVEDCKNPEINLSKKILYFKGKGGTENKVYEAKLELFDEIKVEDSNFTVRDRGTEFVLMKSNEGPFWKRLLADQSKHHWVKVDFNKWKDEDSEDEQMTPDFEDMMRQMADMDEGEDDMKSDHECEKDSDDDLPDLEG